jgi:hypothetical protein
MLSKSASDIARRIASTYEEEAKAAPIKADFKIQAWFRSNRSLNGVSALTVSVWESGKRLHGGGDSLMYICRRLAEAPKPRPLDVLAINPNKATAKGCGEFLSANIIQGGRVQCPSCGMVHRSEEIATDILYEADMHRASEILARMWRRLGGNADIYVKYSPTDPRTKAMADAHGIHMAREKKGLTIYPLANIIKDTQNGATIENRFYALLTA